MLVVLVFVVVMAGAYYRLVHRPLYEQLRGLDETEVRLLFRNLRNQLRLDFEGAQSELTSIAKRDVIRGFDPVQLDKALAQEEQTTTFYKKFTIMDMNGRVVSRPSIPSSNGLDRSDRGYFRGPLGNNGLYIDDVRPFGHGLSVSLSVPVVGLDGKTCGVLAGQVELTGKSPRLCKTTTGWPSRSKHEVILISRKIFKVGHSTGPLDATTGVSTSKSRTTALGSGPNRCPRVRVRSAVSVCSVSVSGSVRSVDRSASRAIPIGAASSPLSSL